MHPLANIVYALTPRGVSEFNNASSLLAKDLRSILSLVDGVTPVAQFEPFLISFLPLDQKFIALEQLGFVRRVGKVLPAQVSAFMAEVNSGFHVSQLHSIDADNETSGFVAL
jgi:hypothetical protein